MDFSFRFQHPWMWLFTIVAAGVTWWSLRSAQRGALTFSDVRLVADAPISWALRCKRLLPWLRLLGWVLLIAATARPQQGLHDFRIRSEGISIAMCLDRSGSMRALDFTLDGEEVTRLAAVKDVFETFVTGDGGELTGRPNDLIGLVVFGGFAESRAPLTLDHTALLDAVESVEVARPVHGPDGELLNRSIWEEELATAIGDAIALGVDRLKNTKAKSKILILLSDGENTAGVVEPLAAAAAAKAFGVKIYAIGVGRTGRAPILEIDAAGREQRVTRRVRLDDATLREIADRTGGKYFHADNTDSLRDVYQEIDQLERTEQTGRLYTEYRELYHWLLLPAALIILLEVVLRSTRFRSLP
ncbi:MAG: VWA domain-containing protein [Pirellulaceae bacterium]|nr:VWA domain-containing protein [Pirellulaceae bacterium]MDP7019890.1 VWA domain-containing protein [Pirellulaceae bacterium]